MDRTSYANIRDQAPATSCPCCGQKLPPSDELRVDLQSNTISAGGQVVKAQPRTVELVAVLLKAYPNFIAREIIISRVWANDALDRTVDAQATRSRMLLDKLGWTVENERGRGYRLAKKLVQAPSIAPKLHTRPMTPGLVLKKFIHSRRRDVDTAARSGVDTI